MNRQLERILEAIIASSDVHNTTSIDNISHLVNLPSGRISLAIHLLKNQKLIRSIGDGYLIQVTPAGLKYFDTARKESPTSYWTEPKIHFIFLAITFIAGMLFGILLGKLF